MTFEQAWEAYAKLYGLNPNIKGTIYLAFKAGWEANNRQENDVWKTQTNDQA
jgi:hypothetical protein